jgi:FixJ family two-component response regulator/glycine cleavage system H lipoate-binding protein
VTQVSTAAAQVRVLVVDDEQVIHASLRKILEREGYRVDAALSAQEALERLAADGYELVITDLMMPGMSGIGLLQAMRARGLAAPVVMITGYPTIRSAVQAMRLGAIDYVAKPFTRRELLGPVRRALRLEDSGLGEAAAQQPTMTSEELVPGSELYLPHHAWARFDQDGTFLVGLEASFLAAVGAVEVVFAPQRAELVEQGHVALQVTCVGGEQHGVAMPLSGEVLAVNHAALTSSALLRADTWLLRIAPSHLGEEIGLLVPRSRP